MSGGYVSRAQYNLVRNARAEAERKLVEAEAELVRLRAIVAERTCESGEECGECSACHSYQEFIATCAKDCQCCDVCSPSVCAGVTAGGICDNWCSCDEESG